MPKNIFEIFESNALAAYWEDVNAAMSQPFLGLRFFPNAKKTGLNLSWIRGNNNLPIALQPSAFDAKASVRNRIGVSELSTEMPVFRESMLVSEKDRQEIETLLSKGQQFAQPTIMKVFDDAKNLVDGALVQSERMRMALLSTGKIAISSTSTGGGTVAYDYNYDVDGQWAASHKKELAGTATWTVANAKTSTPLQDILEAKDKLAMLTGVVPKVLLMNTVTLKGMLASESIRKALNPLADSAVIVTKKKLQELLEEETELKIEVYDKMYKDEAGRDQKFFPDGYVTMLPDNALGNTWYGTTPEEFDLMNSQGTKASVSVVNTGVAITTVKQEHPVNVMTIVSEIVLPSFERMNDIYVLKVQ